MFFISIELYKRIITRDKYNISVSIFDMKAYMYHYVREQLDEMPKAHSIKPQDFAKHIKFTEPLNKDEIESYLGEVNFGRLEKSKNKWGERSMFTFDDGIKDNFAVAEQLEANNASGIFFLTSKPYKEGEFLDVHMIHFIVYQENLDKIYQKFCHLISSKKNINDLFKQFKKNNSRENNFYGDTEKASEIKVFMNRHFPISSRSQFLKEMLIELDIRPKVEDFYLTKIEIQKMEDMGMIIGGHTHSHQVMSRLTKISQLNEINKCKSTLEKFIKRKLRMFSYPYGRESSYNEDNNLLLSSVGFEYAFSVEDKEIEASKIDTKLRDITAIIYRLS